MMINDHPSPLNSTFYSVTVLQITAVQIENIAVEDLVFV